MKLDFIASGDLHLRDTNPRYRKDKFCDNQFYKFKQLLEFTSEETNSGYLFLAGDIFDSKGVNYATVIRAMQHIQEYEDITIFVVPGQHDLRYHRHGLDGTPLGVLLQLDQVVLLSNKEALAVDYGYKVVGAGWDEEPEVEGDILITHRMVTDGKGLWAAQTDFTTGKALLKRYPTFEYIVSGDNHKPHTATVKNRININTGSMMRTSKSQISYKPAFWHIQENGSIDKIFFNIKPSPEVFDTAKIEQDEVFQDNKEQFKELTEQIKGNSEKPNFERILKQVIHELDPSEAVRSEIKHRMETVNI